MISFTHAGSVALNSSVWTPAGTLPAPKIFSTSSTNPMFSISSHSSSTRNLRTNWSAVSRVRSRVLRLGAELMYGLQLG